MANKVRIESVHFDQLKCLKDATIEFDKPLTAIMGVNGCGKTTVLHALACVFKPYDKGEDYHFSYFFTPNTDASWCNSKLSICYTVESKGKEVEILSKEYTKSDRWSPKYDRRPARDVFYIGIDTCLPEIEITSTTTRINYQTEELHGKMDDDIRAHAAYILNKNYEVLTANITYANKKSMIGVTASGIRYSSLSMGTGEQRVFKILRTVLSAPAYSMILIDEIDLLLHVTALKRLIEVLAAIAESHHLQIIFTTHSLEMNDLQRYVDLFYLDQAANKTIVYKSINSDMIYALSGQRRNIYEIYVEDVLSKCIIGAILEELGLRAQTSITIFGAAENAFTLSAGLVLKDSDLSNCLVVLDGDVHRTHEEKETRIRKVLSGTEVEADAKRLKALDLIEQYCLPENTAPEKYIHSMVIESEDDSELVCFAKSIHAVTDTHQWLSHIVDHMGEDPELCYRDLLRIAKKSEKWNAYVAPIVTWFEMRKPILMDAEEAAR